ncbi:MAG: tetratricopeptide repeat protein [Bacteroidetes bacterium]|nr:tetratricopeptide repeat protein [Bacteroidota bacterium]
MNNKRKPTKKDKIQHHKKKQTPSTVSRKLVITLGIIISILGFLIYSNTLMHGFALDDYSVIKENWVVKKGTEGIPLILKTHYRYGYWSSSGVMYRPLSLVMFAVEWDLFYDEDTQTPFASHLINVLLYAFTGMLLFFTLRKVMHKYNILIPFICTLFFIFHPLHTEVVANIKSRDEILSFFFAVLTVQWLWKYLEKKRISSIALSLVFFFFAFLSKEGTITYLAVIPLMIFVFTDIPIKRNLLLSALFLIPTVIFLAIRYKILGGFAGTEGISVSDNLLMAAKDFMTREATAILILGKYLLLIFFPHPLVSDCSYNQVPLTSFSDWRVPVTLAAYAAMGVYALIRLRKKDVVSFGILFFMITFSIFTNTVMTIGSSYGERFLFVPLLGFCLALAWLLTKLMKTDVYEVFTSSGLIAFKRKYIAVFAVTTVILIAYGYKTVVRNFDWKSNNTLYSRDVEYSPNSTHMQYHYGLTTMKDKALEAPTEEEKQAYLDTAIIAFKKAVDIYPYFADAYEQLGLAYFRKNDYDNALKYYNITIEKAPTKARAYSNMGIIYFSRGDYKKAMEVYEKAVKYDSRFADAYMNLGSTYGTLGMFEKSIQSFLNCLQYDPNNAQANYFLGITYEKAGKVQEAQKYLDKAYQLNPALRKTTDGK